MGSWTGTPTELHDSLAAHVPEQTQKSRAWPKAANRLSNRLKRAATFLRAVGILIAFGKSGNSKLTITRQGGHSTVHTDHTVQDQYPCGFGLDDTSTGTVQVGDRTVQPGSGGASLDDTAGGLDDTSTGTVQRKCSNHAGLDDMDALDATFPTLSASEELEI